MTVIAQDDHLTAGAWAACEQPGSSEVSDMVSSLVELWTHFKMVFFKGWVALWIIIILSILCHGEGWNIVCTCFFPEVNKAIIVVKRYPFLVSVFLLPPEKGKNEQKPCWRPITSFAKIHIYSKSFIWTYLIIFSPHLSGQGTSVKLQNKPWWFCLYFLLNLIPLSQTMSIIKHMLLCASISFCLMLSWHCWQLTSSSGHRSRWSFACSALFLIRTTCSGHGPSQALHLPDGWGRTSLQADGKSHICRIALGFCF